MKIRLFLLVAFAIIWNCQVIGQWALSFASYKGGISALGAYGSTVFAGANGGEVFLSKDDGNTWTLITSGEINGSVSSVVAKDSMIFAGTDRGVYRYLPGSGWQRLNDGLPSDSVTRVNTLLIESGGRIIEGTLMGLFVSSDNGATWVSHISEFGGESVNSLFQNGSSLFAGTSTGGIYFSSDSGVNWTERGKIENHSITGFDKFGNKLFASTADTGIFVSNNEGFNWTAVNYGLSNLNIAGLTVNDTTLFAATSMGEWGAFCSADSGNTWLPVTTLTDSFFNAVLTNNHILYLASNSINTGVLSSTDDGASWSQAIIGGSINFRINALVRAGSDIFAGTQGGGVLRTTDFGKVWMPVNSGLNNKYINCLAENDSVLLAGTYPGIWRSTNKGISWTLVDTSQNGACYHILFHDSTFYAAYGSSIHVSNDNGLTWQILPLPQGVGWSGNDIIVIDSTIFVGTGTLGVIWSTDFGKSWNECGSPVNIVCLTLKDSIMFIGTNNGVCRSYDYGVNWDSVGLDSNYISTLVPCKGGLFAGTNTGVYFSTDNGNTWTFEGQGLNNSVQAIIIIDTTVYAGSDGVWARNLSDIITGINEVSHQTPIYFALSQNYPNPFNPSTIIKYSLPSVSKVTIKIYNLLGQEIKTLVNKTESAGDHQITFNAGNLPSGIYLYRIQAGDFIQTRKMVLLK
jgi:hypothetical protein